jgi:hypothetical protein
LGDAEVDVEVAGDHRSRIVVALNTDFRSECHLDEILLQSVFRSLYDPLVNRAYADMAAHYGTAILPARPNSKERKSFAARSIA